jgi:hypothetical protein
MAMVSYSVAVMRPPVSRPEGRLDTSTEVTHDN